jgi:alkanesulfonate monooxygenase SsuD/methylene tetrahydromethanopterin reductase-like flavin-dependent oxidoreductase (luciferase family)
MGCVPSKKRVELPQYNQEESDWFLNEFLRDLDDRREKSKRDALDAKSAAEALVKIASTPEEKLFAAEAMADANQQIVCVLLNDIALRNEHFALRRKYRELQGLVLKNT